MDNELPLVEIFFLCMQSRDAAYTRLGVFHSFSVLRKT